MYARSPPPTSPPAIIAAYVAPGGNEQLWRAHPATNPNVFAEAPTMEGAVEKVRRRLRSYDRAKVQPLDDAAHDFVVRRTGWNEDYGYYAGEGAGPGGEPQRRWQGRAFARRMPVAEAYATAAAISESTVVEVWPKKKKR